jgi:hypothetical protein
MEAAALEGTGAPRLIAKVSWSLRSSEIGRLRNDQKRKALSRRRNAHVASSAPPIRSPLAYSFSERRAHVHVQHADGEAKFWIDPNVELAANFNLKPKQVTEAQRLIEEHLDEIRNAWAKHFPAGGSH